MSKVRLTREQSRDQTRQRLLDAAQSIFLAKGFVAASVEDIAELAGYTRGAFYSNFASKSELFLQLLKRDHENVMGDMRAIFEGGETREQMEESVLRYYSSHFRDNECFLLWMEAKLQAARDPEFRVGFIACMGELREATTEYIRQFSQLVGTPLPLPARSWPSACWRCPMACSSASPSIRRACPRKRPKRCWPASSAGWCSATASPASGDRAAARPWQGGGRELRR